MFSYEYKALMTPLNKLTRVLKRHQNNIFGNLLDFLTLLSAVFEATTYCILQVFYHETATACQIDSNKVSNLKSKPDLRDCVKNETIESTAPPQQPNKRGKIFWGYPVYH